MLCGRIWPAGQGRDGIKELLRIIASEQDARLPIDAHASLVVLAAGLQALQTMIGSIEKRIVVQHRSDEASRRLRSIPGIGIIGATAISALSLGIFVPPAGALPFRPRPTRRGPVHRGQHRQAAGTSPQE